MEKLKVHLKCDIFVYLTSPPSRDYHRSTELGAYRLFYDVLTQLPMIQIDPYGNIQTYRELCTETTACSIKFQSAQYTDNRKFDKCAARQLHDDNNFTFIQESVRDGNITVPSIENVTVEPSSEAYKLNS